MGAPVVGFTADVDLGLLGESFIEITPTDDGSAIEVRVARLVGGEDPPDDEYMIVSHDEARQIIAGLASVIS